MLEPYVFKETRTVPRRGEMSNHLFLFDNNMLSRYNDLYKLFSRHDCPLNPNIRNLNAILKMLKQEHSFLREGESTSQQQVFRDLNKAFTSFFKGKSAYPKFKSKKNPKQSFRIQKKRKQYSHNKQTHTTSEIRICSFTTQVKNIANY